MPKELPFDSESPIYSVGTTLDERDYRFDVRWNARDGAWYFDMYTSEDVLVRAGVKVKLGTLMFREVGEDSPNGVFFAVDTSGRGEEAGLEDLGERVVVQFYTIAELVELDQTT